MKSHPFLLPKCYSVYLIHIGRSPPPGEVNAMTLEVWTPGSSGPFLNPVCGILPP